MEILKIHMVFSDFLLYFMQFNGIVVMDHVNNEGHLVWGEHWFSPHTCVCGSLAILQKESVQLQKYTCSTRLTNIVIYIILFIFPSNLPDSIPLQHITKLVKWCAES